MLNESCCVMCFAEMVKYHLYVGIPYFFPVVSIIEYIYFRECPLYSKNICYTVGIRVCVTSTPNFGLLLSFQICNV